MKRKTSYYLWSFLVVFFMNAVVYAQSKTVTGKITEEGSADGLPGVSVIIKGSTTGTTTDINGQFSLSVPDNAAILRISYVGMETQEIAVGERTSIDVVMKLSAALIDEIVVVGYGTQKKSVTTGAISKVKAEDLEKMPVSRLEQSLSGRTSGVRVTAASGQPGAASTVRIRGTTTINNSDPLYVVDGVIINGGIDYLNQGDIESIEVLKDAASASIYGARAANGVILVTTKKGKEGKTQVNYNMYYGWQNPWKKLALLDATEYGILMNESSVASGGNVIFPDPSKLGTGTDWQEAVFHKNAPIQNHDVSFSSATEKSTYYTSFSYFDQSGIVSEEDSRYKRFTVRFNSSHKVSKRITFGNTIGYTRTHSTSVAENTEYGSPLMRAINLDPITPIYETDPDILASGKYTNFNVVKDAGGTYGISDYVTSEAVNPLAALAVQQSYGFSDKVVGNGFLEIELFDGLKFNSNIGLDLSFWGSEGFSPVYYLNATNRVDINSYGRSSARGLYTIFTNTLAYNKIFGKHNISAVVGSVAENNKGMFQGGSLFGIPATSLEQASLAFPVGATSQSFYGYEYHNTLASLLARFNYNYNSKYLLSLVMRRDGSSKFGDNNKFGYFPSASVGWIVSEESFFPKNDYVNFLKVRGSYGINGNDKIGDFRYVSTVSGGRNYTFGPDEALVNGASPNAIANPDLKWEQTSQLNFGLDAKLFKNISFTLDYFNKRTNGMLLDIAVPGYVGNNGPVGNVADMKNMGFETEIGYNKKFGAFDLGLSGNLSYVKNEVISLGADKEYLNGQVFSPQALEITRTSVGLPVGYFYGYQTDGIFQTQAEVDDYVAKDGTLMQPNAKPGDFKFKDTNGDGVLDSDDRTYLGDPTPNWTYGANVTLKYKGFDLVLFGQGVWGNQIYRATRRFDLQMANMTADALGRWTGEGTSEDYPRLIATDPNNNFSRSSDFYVESGAFFRIRTLQLGYTLPKNLIAKAKMTNARVYVSGNNLLTFTKYSGFDPEIGGGSSGVDRGVYPQARSYMVGLSVNF